jgi:hypothetical protein
VREWRAQLLANGASVSVAAKAYRLIRAVLTTAVEADKILPRNPCRIRGQAAKMRVSVQFLRWPRSSSWRGWSVATDRQHQEATGRRLPAPFLPARRDAHVTGDLRNQARGGARALEDGQRRPG